MSSCKTHQFGCVNNRGLLKLKPEYKELFDILYELGQWGDNGPNAGTTVTDFLLPDSSLSTFTGSATGAGFLKFVDTSESREDPFFFTDEEYVLITEYTELVAEISWKAEKPVKLTFAAPPSGTEYYDPDLVYPTLNLDNELMVYNSSKGCTRTQQYYNYFVYVDRPCTVEFKLRAIVPDKIVYPFIPPAPEVYQETIEVEGEPTVACLITDLGETLLHTAAPGFEQVAADIKRTVIHYSHPNPLIGRPSGQVRPTDDDAAEEKLVVICKNIAVYETGSERLGTNQYWALTNKM